MSTEKRKLNRRHFSYYMRVRDEMNGEVVGTLLDISTGGFKLDSDKAIPTNKDFRLRIELSLELAPKTFMVFGARSRWCQPDPYDPISFNIGFQITDMTPRDREIFARIFEKYGSSQETPRKSHTDYRWR
jgi:hypothetical protein